MTEASKEALEQIEEEIKDTQRKAGEEENFEIEIVDGEEEEKDSDQEDYGSKVQRRIKKLVDQRREAELQARQQQEQTAQLQSRLNRLEQGNATNAQHQAEHAFHNRYQQTRAALSKAVEEGDTEAQLDFTEQIADMRAAVRVSESQKKQAQHLRLGELKRAHPRRRPWAGGRRIAGSIPLALSAKPLRHGQLMSSWIWKDLTKILMTITASSIIVY